MALDYDSVGSPWGLCQKGTKTSQQPEEKWALLPQFLLGVAVSITSKSGQWKIKAGSVVSSFGIFYDGWADSDGIKLPPKESSLQQAKQRTFTENLLENQEILGDLLDQQLQSQFLPADQKDRGLIWRKDTMCHDYCSVWP